MIKAETYSDDHAAEVNFDATAWFEQATDEEILELARVDWGGDYEADDVARFFEDKVPAVDAMFTYIQAYNRVAEGDSIGFECRVDADDALAWIREYRPHLIPALDPP